MAALLHGVNEQFLIYAIVLGKRLRDESWWSSSRYGGCKADRVLLCGPGSVTSEPANRRALLAAGWTHLVPVDAIKAPHLDKSRTKRHAWVFTKLRVLQLPYKKVLLVDLDILPRWGTHLDELLQVQAPAAKYHSSIYNGKEPAHGDVIPDTMRDGSNWSPNAGVMRLDPKATREERKHEMNVVLEAISNRTHPSYLPEQYYLAENVHGWRHIGSEWNWEVWPKWDDPKKTYPVSAAVAEAKRQGWEEQDNTDSSPKKKAKVWHFSGTAETNPFSFPFVVAADANGIWKSAKRVFECRDEDHVVALALYEWRQYYEDALFDENLRPCLEDAMQRVADGAWRARRSWRCEGCLDERTTTREITDYSSCILWKIRWACADCIVERLLAGERCKCTACW